MPSFTRPFAITRNKNHKSIILSGELQVAGKMQCSCAALSGVVIDVPPELPIGITFEGLAVTKGDLLAAKAEADRGTANIVDSHVKLHTFTTDQVRPEDRFSFWVDEFAQCFGKIYLDSYQRTGFHQSLKSIQLGGLSLVRISGSSISGKRPEAGLDYAELFPLQIIARLGPGPNLLSAGERSVSLNYGQMTLIDSRRPGTFDSGNTTDSLVIGLGPQVVERWRLMDHANSYNQLISGRRGWSALLSGLMRNVNLEDLQTMSSVAEVNSFADHICSMLSFSLTEFENMKEPRLLGDASRVLYDRMVAWMREHHVSSEVHAGQLAQEFDVSVRYVHALFAKHSKKSSFLQTLHAMRLETAWRLMQRPAGSRLTVAGIAYRSGFASASTFSRVFRKHFGHPPRPPGDGW